MRFPVLACSLVTAYVSANLVGMMAGKQCGGFNA